DRFLFGGSVETVTKTAASVAWYGRSGCFCVTIQEQPELTRKSPPFDDGLEKSSWGVASCFFPAYRGRTSGQARPLRRTFGTGFTPGRCDNTSGPSACRSARSTPRTPEWSGRCKARKA